LRTPLETPEKARWEEPVGFKALRMTGRATLAEVEAIIEATFGANTRAAIVYEDMGEVDRRSLERVELRDGSDSE
jgi:hypothetical protein